MSGAFEHQLRRSGRTLLLDQPDLWRLAIRGEIPDVCSGIIVYTIEQTKTVLGLPPPDQPSMNKQAWIEAHAWVAMQAAVNPRIVDTVAAAQKLYAEGVAQEDITFVAHYDPDELEEIFFAALAGRSDPLPFPNRR